MRPQSAYNSKRLVSDGSQLKNRPGSCTSKRIQYSPIMIDSINTTFNISSYHSGSRSVSKGSIIDLEQDLNVNDKLSLESKNLFTCITLPHAQIANLTYSNNRISKIERLQSCRYLVHLDFSNNQLEEISGLPEMSCLKVLLLGRNRIKRICSLDSQIHLQVLDLSVNFIQNIGIK